MRECGCIGVRALLSPCVKTNTMKMPTIENRLNAIVTETHTRHDSFYVRFIAHQSKCHLPLFCFPFTCRLAVRILTAFDFHSKCYRSTRPKCDGRDFDWIFYFIRSHHRLYYVCGADSKPEGWLSVDTRVKKKKQHRLNRIDNSHTTDGCSPFSLSTMASSMR